MDKKLLSYLTKNNITYRLHTHKAVYTVAESHAEESIQKIPGLRGKTLFLKDEKATFYLVGMPGEKRLDFKTLQEALHVKKLRMASPEELLHETGLVPGSVSIFGAVGHKHVTLVLDQAIWNAERVCFHPNINTETLELPHTSLAHYYEVLPNRKKIVSL